jgi:hypothetical protein
MQAAEGCSNHAMLTVLQTNTYLNFMQERVIGSLELVADILGLLDYSECLAMFCFIAAQFKSIQAVYSSFGNMFSWQPCKQVRCSPEALLLLLLVLLVLLLLLLLLQSPEQTSAPASAL